MALALILARNLVERLDVPAFLVDAAGSLLFYNVAAGDVIGKRFEEMGVQPREVWNQIGPFDAEGNRFSSRDLPMTHAVREGRPGHGTFSIKTASEALLAVEVSAFPLRDGEGFHGTVVYFWPAP
jgi:PAS domain-containing protein